MTIPKLDSNSEQGMNEQLLKTSGADVLSSRKKLRKTLGGWYRPHPLYVRGLIQYINKGVCFSTKYSFVQGAALKVA